MAPERDNLAEGAAVRVACCVLTISPWSRPFAVRQADEIAAARERRRPERPELYDGVVQLLRVCTLELDVSTAAFVRNGIKNFLNWRALGYPEAASDLHVSIVAKWRSALPSDTLKAHVLECTPRQPIRRLAESGNGAEP